MENKNSVIDSQRYIETMINEIQTNINIAEKELENILGKLEIVDTNLSSLNEQLTHYTSLRENI
jgi:hypothetical protein